MRLDVDLVVSDGITRGIRVFKPHHRFLIKYALIQRLRFNILYYDVCILHFFCIYTTEPDL